MAKRGATSGIYKDPNIGVWVVPDQHMMTTYQRRKAIDNHKRALRRRRAKNRPSWLTRLPTELRMKIYEAATMDYDFRLVLYLEHSSEGTSKESAQQKDSRWDTVEGVQRRFFIRFEGRFHAHGFGFDVREPKWSYVHAGLLVVNKLIRQEFIDHLSAGGVTLEAHQLGGSCGGCGCYSTLASLVPEPWRSLVTIYHEPLSGVLHHGFPALRSIETVGYPDPDVEEYDCIEDQEETVPSADDLLEMLMRASFEPIADDFVRWFDDKRRQVHDELGNVRWVRRMKIGYIDGILRYENDRARDRRCVLRNFAMAITYRGPDGKFYHDVEYRPEAEEHINRFLGGDVSEYAVHKLEYSALYYRDGASV
ncbi:uncharacterized protein AB675_2710 [Cyphellophora attinorum]|uniref:Uncharacterized protein n=1 Tax=Cyphellophora attinorum TaxID=1664694 RepID=A0A0N0NRH9_9EURO|nr:uncharacterized protein AB675_2710 [Phialophora attinorum]KPI44869.1 hypothetical protein AB675_2710 [Phialophora attinorum]